MGHGIAGIDRRWARAPLAIAAFTASMAFGASTAHAAVSATAALESTASGTRVVVTLKSSKAWTARSRPSAVTAKLHSKTYRLRRQRGSRMAQAWATRFYAGNPGAGLLGLAGKRIKVLVKSRAARRTLRPLLGAPAQTAPGVVPGPSPAAPAPAPAPSATPTPAPTADARTRFLTMLTSSGWNDPCVGSACGSDVMNFCADGRFLDRFTSGNTGQDYHYTGAWQLASEVASGVYQGYDVVEARVVAQTTDQWGAPKTFEWAVDLSEQYPSGLFGGQEFARVALAGC